MNQLKEKAMAIYKDESLNKLQVMDGALFVLGRILDQLGVDKVQKFMREWEDGLGDIVKFSEAVKVELEMMNLYLSQYPDGYEEFTKLMVED